MDLYGNRSEGQYGIDIIDTGANKPLRAAQCKSHPNATLQPKEIRDEVEKVKGAPVKVDHYAIISSGTITTGCQNTLVEINKENREAGLFLVEILHRESLEDLLEEYPELLEEVLPAAFRYYAKTSKQLDALVKNLYPQPGAIIGEGLVEDVNEVKKLVDQREFQMAKVLLDRLKEKKWDQMSDEQKFIVQTNKANVLMAEGSLHEASRLLLDAKKWLPDDERALTNEAVAYELIQEGERAFEIADSLLSKYPASSKINAAWVRNAPTTMGFEEIEERVPAHQMEDGEVLTALAKRAQKAKLHNKAQEYAKKAMELSENWPVPKLIYGQTCIQMEIDRANKGKDPLQVKMDESELLSAVDAFTQALALSKKQNTTELAVESILGRGVAQAMLSKMDLAEQDFKEALRIKPDHPMAHYNMGVHLQNSGDTEGAINEMRTAIALGKGTEAKIRLCNLLFITENPENHREATQIAVGLCMDNSEVQHPEEALALAMQGLAMEKRFEEAEELLEAQKDVIGKLPWVLLRMNLHIEQGNEDEASKSADEALKLVEEKTPSIQLRSLAILLEGIDRHKEALPLWQQITIPGEYGPYTAGLIACANRLGQHDLILETCAEIREAGIMDRWLLNEELNLLEQYNMAKAVEVLQAFLAKYPDDKIMRFRLARLGVILERNDLLVNDKDALPSFDDLEPFQGRWAVEILCKTGKVKEGLKYCYQLLRHYFDNMEAHQAYLSLFMSWEYRDGFDLPTEITEVQPGCAVLYEKDGEDRWVVIEDEFEPMAHLSEVAPNSFIATELIGKKVDDKFTPAHGLIGDQTATVKRIVNKFVFRFQDIMNEWQNRFPENPVVESRQVTMISKEDGTEEPDMSEIKEVIERHKKRVQDIGEEYKKQFVPMHILAEWLGKNDVEAISHAVQMQLPIRCCSGSSEERKRALEWLASDPAVVLDMTAIGTLLVLGMQEELSKLDLRFIVSQSTLNELHEMEKEMERQKKQSPDFSDAEQKSLEYLQKIIVFITRSCTVEATPGLASLSSDKRDLLMNGFGQHGAESMILGAKNGYVLWADDVYMASLGRKEFGTRSVWTQAVFLHLLQISKIDAKTYNGHSAKLTGCGYVFTSTNANVLLEAGSQVEWDPDKWPFKQCLEELSNESIALVDRLSLFAVTTVRIYKDQPLLSDVQQRVIIRMLENLAKTKDSMEGICALPKSLERLFGLDVVHAAAAIEIVDGWIAASKLRITSSGS